MTLIFLNRNLIIGMKTGNIMNKKLFLIFLIVSLFLTSCDAVSISIKQREAGGGASESIALVYPHDGHHLSVGEMADVQSQVSNAASTLSVALLVNDATYRKDDFADSFTTADVYQPWTPKAPGVYTLQTILDHGGITSNIIMVYVDAVKEEPAEEPPPVEEPVECPEPVAEVIDHGNCRSGPGTAYNLVNTLKPGQIFPITAVSGSGNWWEIEYNDGGNTCWVWDKLVEICGDTDDVPEVLGKEKDAAEEAPSEPEPSEPEPEDPVQPAAFSACHDYPDIGTCTSDSMGFGGCSWDTGQNQCVP